MQIELFIAHFNQSTQFISSKWKHKYGALLYDEHWSLLGERIYSFVIKHEICSFSLPYFKEEIISDLPKHYESFEPLKSVFAISENERAQLIAKAIEETPIASLLVILGQRKTSATIIDENGIPPLKEELLKTCFEPYNNQICKASRAREKHVSRNKEDSFWGNIEGNPEEKEEVTKATVQKIIEEKTWWNVFTHYKHEVVYEIRVASGEGIRWKKNELELIGFLEPFL